MAYAVVSGDSRNNSCCENREGNFFPFSNVWINRERVMADYGQMVADGSAGEMFLQDT